MKESGQKKVQSDKVQEPIDPGISNDPAATANAAVPAGSARFSAAEQFISSTDLNSTKTKK